ncbi:MAG: hypothetical protein RRZ64_02185 [Rikenellaceae bacterium]
MKRLFFSCLLIILFALPTYGQDTITAHRYNRWQRMVPRYVKVQYAGSIGIVSVGTGWNYGHEHWATDVLLGFVPRYSDTHAMITCTLKQLYIPWNIPLGSKYILSPLTCGIFMNTLLDRDFWVSEPDKYPKGYYGFSTRLRTHIFMGQQFTVKLPVNKIFKSVAVYYEVSTCDLYLISAVTNKYLKPKDYLSLGFGVKFQIL